MLICSGLLLVTVRIISKALRQRQNKAITSKDLELIRHDRNSIDYRELSYQLIMAYSKTKPHQKQSTYSDSEGESESEETTSKGHTKRDAKKKSTSYIQHSKHHESQGSEDTGIQRDWQLKVDSRLDKISGQISTIHSMLEDVMITMHALTKALPKYTTPSASTGFKIKPPN